EDAVTGVRRTTLAARLKAIYGSVDKVDAFVGMVSEPHMRGTEFGPLQLAIWARQFAASRDGDRFFYAGDPTLARITQLFRIDYRTTLSRLVFLDTGEHIPAQAFKAGAVTPTPLAPNALATPSTPAAPTGPTGPTGPAANGLAPVTPSTPASSSSAP